MAGGDGSQAIVAAVAAEFGLPYACVPAGTRNHFALDLGVDRDDVVGALEAFVDGGERRVDLAEVNGRVFVNNVSLGLYAEAVQRAGYRDAKIRTLLDTVPDVLGPGGDDLDMRWSGPGGHEHHGGLRCWSPTTATGSAARVGSGTRPRIDDGLLGITVVGATTGRGERGRSLQSPWREWSAPVFEVDADRPRVPPASTARRSSLRRRCSFASARSPTGANRSQAPGRLALGAGPRRHLGRGGRAGAHRRRLAPHRQGHTRVNIRE